MKKSLRILLAVLVVALLALFITSTRTGQRVQFVTGGALVNLGYRMQDHLASYDFIAAHEHDISPEEIWEEMRFQNALASTVRETFPRTSHHPLVAIVACMDARIDTNELLGDTRRYYYILRTAGSVLDRKEVGMLELAVANGVKVIVLTTHSDCAAEAAAADPQSRAEYPALAEAVDERDEAIDALLERPLIAEHIASGDLLVKEVRIDTRTEEISLEDSD